jgi:hypothetical protein
MREKKLGRNQGSHEKAQEAQKSEDGEESFKINDFVPIREIRVSVQHFCQELELFQILTWGGRQFTFNY